MTELNFQISTGVGSDGLRLEVIDEASRTHVVTFNRLTPEQIYRILTGGTINVTGEMASETSVGRIGKWMYNRSVDVPANVFTALGYGGYGDREAKIIAGTAWAKKQHPGWDAHEARTTNSGGVRVILRRWVADGEPDADGVVIGPDSGTRSYYARLGSSVAFGPDRQAARNALVNHLPLVKP